MNPRLAYPLRIIVGLSLLAGVAALFLRPVESDPRG